jgi:hypothetical protein
VLFNLLKTIKEAIKKSAKQSTLHCIESVKAYKKPKTKVPNTMAIFSVTS